MKLLYCKMKRFLWIHVLVQLGLGGFTAVFWIIVLLQDPVLVLILFLQMVSHFPHLLSDSQQTVRFCRPNHDTSTSMLQC